MWKAKIIMETIGKIDYSQDELNFVDSVINGGKTDHITRSQTICAYMEVEGMEQNVYDKLCVLANEH